MQGGKMSAGNYLRSLAEWIADLRYNSLPADVIHTAKRCLLDYLGATLAGSRSDAGNIAWKPFSAEEIPNGSGVIGKKQRTSKTTAAFLNGIFGHALEIDDYYVVRFPLGHLGVIVFPALIALMENESDDRQFIASTVAGFETTIRVGNALGPTHYAAGWHSTGTLGTFGATAATCNFLGATPEQTIWALGLAGTQAAGLIESFSSYGKPLHAGRASSNGVTAALLATHGFRGTESILEGSLGMGKIMSASFKPEELIVGLGEEFLMKQTSFKKYFCACFDTVDAILEAKKRFALQDPEQIEEIMIGTTLNYARTQRGLFPTSITAAKVSTEYCVATAFLTGHLGLDSFEDIDNIDVTKRRLMGKVKLIVDERVVKLFEGGHYAVSVHVRYGGRDHELLLEDTRGHFLNPLSDEELYEKFTDVSSKSEIDPILVRDAVMNLGSGNTCKTLRGALWPK
jgi:2-methylcitrate dehydratase PrpD